MAEEDEKRRNSRLRRGLGARGLAARFAASHFDGCVVLGFGFECVGVMDGLQAISSLMEEKWLRERSRSTAGRAGL
jgi:hypothetical protein